MWNLMQNEVDTFQRISAHINQCTVIGHFDVLIAPTNIIIAASE